jgi:hypothetical protein
MSPKILRRVVLVLWPCLFYACTSVRYNTQSAATTPAAKLRGTKIVAVQMKSGDYYRFNDERPANLVNDRILGQALGWREFSRQEVRSVVTDKKGQITEIGLKDGSTFKPTFARYQDGKFIAYGLDEAAVSVSLPYSEAETITVRKQRGDTVVAIVVLVVAAGLIVAVASSAGKKPTPPPPEESCPLVYSFDSEDYVLDAEPYGGAVCPGLKRSEWLTLDHLREVEGHYKLRMTNELEEREHTDELKLVVVDHPGEALVVPDTWGGLHSFLRPQSPLKAIDSAGNDISSYVTAQDLYFWTGHPGPTDVDEPEDLRQTLTFEFSKPAGARKVKLLAGAWTTHQGSASARGLLELHGREVDQYLKEVDSHGPTYQRLLAWYAREELYQLKVWVETPEGWKVRGLIYGGGPFVAKEKAYLLDISDVPGEVLRIRLNPPRDFWMLDRLAVDYSPDLALKPLELTAASAVDQDGRDIRSLLAAQDDASYEMPNRGDRADLEFEAPSRVEGLARTVLLKATGYYDIKLEARGEPRRDILDRVQNEPGFTLRFAHEWLERTLYARAKSSVD